MRYVSTACPYPVGGCEDALGGLGPEVKRWRTGGVGEGGSYREEAVVRGKAQHAHGRGLALAARRTAQLHGHARLDACMGIAQDGRDDAGGTCADG